MAKGIALPLGADTSGGMATTDKAANNNKIIMTALGGCDSENAFQQDLGLGERMVFDINDANVRGTIFRRLVRIFDEFRLQKRFSLMRETVRFRNAGNQELELSFQFLDLESEEEQTFRHVYTRLS